MLDVTHRAVLMNIGKLIDAGILEKMSGGNGTSFPSPVK